MEMTVLHTNRTGAHSGRSHIPFPFIFLIPSPYKSPRSAHRSSFYGLIIRFSLCYTCHSRRFPYRDFNMEIRARSRCRHMPVWCFSYVGPKSVSREVPLFVYSPKFGRWSQVLQPRVSRRSGAGLTDMVPWLPNMDVWQCALSFQRGIRSLSLVLISNRSEATIVCVLHSHKSVSRLSLF